MRKLFTLFTAMLMAVAVSATTPSTDFEGGYQFTATAASIDGNIEKTTHNDDVYLRYFDRDPCGTAEWEITCTTACYVTVTLNMYDNSWNYSDVDAEHKAYKNGGHKFTVQVNKSTKEVGSLAEASESSAIGDINLSGKICIPEAGTYTIKLLNNRAWSKCGVSSITLTNAGNIPSTDFAGDGYAFKADDAVLSGINEASKLFIEQSVTPHYIRYADHSQPGPVVSWTFIATRACFVSVTLNFADNSAFYAGNKHIMEVQLWDEDNHLLDTIAEGPAFVGDGFTENGVDKKLTGHILVPKAGLYTIKMLNNRSHSKTGIYGITLKYVDSPKTLYLNPGPWDADGAEEAYAVWDMDQSHWTPYMTLVDGKTDIYQATIMASTTNVIFARFDATTVEAPVWDSEWNKTGDLTIPSNRDLFIIEGFSYGNWSKLNTRLEDGFYLVGKFDGVEEWSVSDLTEAKKFEWKKKDEKGDEYEIIATLKAGDHLKAIYVALDELVGWYPDGDDNDYVVAENEAGAAKTIYFRPDYNSDWASRNGHFYVAPNDTPSAIDNVNAAVVTKVIENGMLVIEKNGVRYNVLGNVIR